MQKVKPKKALGQHFLTDERVARRIASTINGFVPLTEPVVEVGPGMGMLTKYIIEDGYNLSVVEIDRESVAYLEQEFPSLNGHIIEGDFLQMTLDKLAGADGRLCVIGNYPYNISSQIFFHVLDYKDTVNCCAGMLQREVAERLAAGPGTKVRGILSVLLQAWYDVEYLFTVDEGVFNPPPKVKSGVVRMTRRKEVTSLGCDERLFRAVVKTTFGQRRKTIRNSLRSLLQPGAVLPAEHPLLAMRPEQLTVEQFIELTNLLTSLNSASK